jgi:hypothetical protein
VPRIVTRSVVGTNPEATAPARANRALSVQSGLPGGDARRHLATGTGGTGVPGGGRSGRQ